MTAPVLVDLFCGAGGAAAGYIRAGFDVVGIDVAPQPHFPSAFFQEDALGYLAAIRDERVARPDVIHASPPCQGYSGMTKRWGRSDEHPRLIEPVRAALVDLGIPYVIENVEGAPLISPVRLCGSMFGLGSQGYQLRRHRLFESSTHLWPPAPCAHVGPALPVYGHAGGSSKRDGLRFPGTDAWREGMGIDWMTGGELAESIPPAFTEWIGAQMMETIR